MRETTILVESGFGRRVEPEPPKHYFIADCHFAHSNIHLKFRKEFSSQEEHNETIHQKSVIAYGYWGTSSLRRVNSGD